RWAVGGVAGVRLFWWWLNDGGGEGVFRVGLCRGGCHGCMVEGQAWGWCGDRQCRLPWCVDEGGGAAAKMVVVG
nr:hypothetical protein [Tanacetum cinerariifolium]